MSGIGQEDRNLLLIPRRDQTRLDQTRRATTTQRREDMIEDREKKGGIGEERGAVLPTIFKRGGKRQEKEEEGRKGKGRCPLSPHSPPPKEGQERERERREREEGKERRENRISDVNVEKRSQLLSLILSLNISYLLFTYPLPYSILSFLILSLNLSTIVSYPILSLILSLNLTYPILSSRILSYF